MAEPPASGSEMPFLEHLEELRWRIFKSVAALGVGSALGFFLVHYFKVTELLIRPVRPHLRSESQRECILLGPE